MEARELPQPQPQAFELLLRIRHPSMDPEEISAQLQISAEHCFKAGEPRQPTAGGPALSGSVYSETYWLASLNPGSADLSAQLGRALAVCTTRFMRPHREFFHRIQSEGGQVHLLVELNPEAVSGFTLTPELAREINTLGVPVDFEFAPN